MSIARRAFLGAALLLSGVFGAASAADGVTAKWVEGRHYALIRPAQPSQAPKGKVEVTEVFSYGCPGCFQFQPTMEKIKAAMPANAEVMFVHAAWNKGESWPLFQRSFITAQALGVAEKNHSAMFNAIWGANGDLAVVDPNTQRLKARQPTIEDVARWYAKRGGVTEEKFLATAKSFSVDMRIKQSEALIKGYSPPATPTLVVAGKYRIEMQSVASTDELIALLKFLVQKEAATA